jgi:hypothetical protein
MLASMHPLHAPQPRREWQPVVPLTEIFHIAVNDSG